MAFEGHAGVSVGHAFAVIDHLDESASGIADNHFDAGSTGINGILHQFFDHRCRTLDHFTGSNLVSYGIRQKSYDVAHNIIV